jgi:putative ABC transport system ATP-binding protein/lipoprotein-releasing system ATP-binding protein
LPQISLEDIRKVYRLEEMDLKAVDGVSLDIEKGEFVSIVGHSGSGKTTLLSIIGGILSPTSGSMVFDGTDIYSLNEDKISEYRANKVGYVFQFSSLLPVLTSKENLLLPTLFSTEGRHDNYEKRAFEYLEMVGLEDKANAYPAQLSGGQQRRVAIARSVMNDPDVIIADEPTGDLDEETETEVMEFFKRMNSERNITFILVTHSTELSKYASRRLRMTQGKIHEIEKES